MCNRPLLSKSFSTLEKNTDLKSCGYAPKVKILLQYPNCHYSVYYLPCLIYLLQFWSSTYSVWDMQRMSYMYLEILRHYWRYHKKWKRERLVTRGCEWCRELRLVCIGEIPAKRWGRDGLLPVSDKQVKQNMQGHISLLFSMLYSTAYYLHKLTHSQCWNSM